ncbi:hypothetical protein IMCC20628_01792 [Hoeflea sp. IMCC20628]|uniref:hypothetical protein n=1 Tax=Hoeflea sp. IMCC20628 TaxID=1620421 RepID=UPI00063A9B01|nr:hypothetical protein [Hoeflea sp. IMCC20628]AKI00502.1 hypothetical protein IMCC20628_01792 [Hoeflea sp. IMCC20628]
MFRRNDPALGKPRVIEIGMQMTLKEFIERNQLSIGPRVEQGYKIDADKLTDRMPILFDDNWIELHYLEGNFSFELPPGRTLQITQEAGRVNGFAIRPFAQPLPLNEIRDYTEALVATLKHKGWQVNPPLNIPSTPEDFDLSGKSLFAEMSSAGGNILQMNLRDYGLAPKQESFILNFNPFHKSAEATRSYLLQITIDTGEVAPSYSDLIYPRRIFVNGDVKKPVPLRLWIQDPDWTPQEAGMVPTAREERQSRESSKWKIPSGQ